MIFIACCDENKSHLNHLRQEIAMLGVGERVNAAFFSTQDQLFDYIDRYGEMVDILLCDTVLQSKSAIPMVGKIKERYPLVQVIFMSVLAAWCEKTYAVDHVYFLKKPVRQAALANAVSLAASKAKRSKERYINIQNKGDIQTIPFSEILYIESILREIRIVTPRQSVLSYSRISDIAEQLDARFLSCHKSFIVNLDKVERIGGLQFLLADGQTVPISQARFREVRERYQHYTGQFDS